VKKIDVGTAEFGIVDTGVGSVARAQGAKIKVVSMLFDKSPYCMWMWKEAGINTPKDLVGKKIGAPPGDAQRTIFPALATANGFDPDKVTFVNIGAEAKQTALAAKQVDVVFDYYSGAPFYYKALGQENVKYMMFADWGVDVYSNALIVTDKYAKENPGIIKRFVKASLRGWEFTLKNPEEAINIMAKYRPEIDQPLMLANLKLIIDLFRTTPARTVCPNFYVLSHANGCAFSPQCDYCYLKSSFWGLRAQEAFSNVEAMLREVDAWIARDDLETYVLNSGNLSDSLAFEHVRPLTSRLVELFRQEAQAKGRQGRLAVLERFTADRMAAQFAAV
jgi:hypothetical protein